MITVSRLYTPSGDEAPGIPVKGFVDQVQPLENVCEGVPARLTAVGRPDDGRGPRPGAGILPTVRKTGGRRAQHALLSAPDCGPAEGTAPRPCRLHSPACHEEDNFEL